MALKVEHASESSGGLFKNTGYRLLGTPPKFLGSGSRIYISNMFPGNADVAGLAATF